MNTPKYLLFDLDGTLVDSLADLTCALNLLGGELNHPPLSCEQVRGIVGDGAANLIKRAFGESNYQRDQLSRFLEIYNEHLLDNTRCYPGISELLDRHPAKRLAIITNKPFQLTMDLLTGLGLEHHFRVIIGGDSFPKKKPDPLPVLKALEQLGALPTEAVMVGDHHTDLYSGRAAGTRTCFCAYGLGNDDGLNADYRVSQPQELLPLFPGTAS